MHAAVPAPPAPRRAAVRQVAAHAAVASLFAVLAAWWTYPLVLHLSTHVPGTGAGDNLCFVWNMWWWRQALAQHVDPFRTAAIFHPVGVDLAQHTHTALNGFLGATVLGGISPLAAQNVLLLVAVFLNGFVAYLLAHRLAGNRVAAMAAGIIFGSAAPILVRLQGHFNLVGAWVLPAVLLLLVIALERRRLWRSLAVGAGFALAAYVDYYYLVYAMVAAGVLLLTRWLRADIDRRPRPSNAVSKTIAALLALDAILAIAVLLSGGFVLRMGPLRVSMLETRNLRAAGLLLAVGWWLARSRFSVRLARRAPILDDVRMLVPAAAVFGTLALPLIAGAVRVIAGGGYSSPKPITWATGFLRSWATVWAKASSSWLRISTSDSRRFISSNRRAL
jgi:hypothetical protein